MSSVFKRGGKKAKGPWYATWQDHTGKRRTKCTGTTDKATAERIARKHEADAALRREGVIDPAQEAVLQQSRRSVESHLVDYEQKLRAAGRTDEYVCDTLRYIRTIASSAGFTAAADIAVDDVSHYLLQIKDAGKSARTVQANATAIKGFTRWLVKHGKLQIDPLVTLTTNNPRHDRRHERRMFRPDEWPWLDAATRRGPDRRGTSGRERALLYRTAIETGLRASELQSLRRGNLCLDADPPYITCTAGSTKNGQPAKQIIQPS